MSKSCKPNSISVPAVTWIALIHVGALAAPWTFTWAGFWLMLGMYFLTGCIGICLGSNRLLSLASFETYRPVSWIIVWIGGYHGDGSDHHRAAMHRTHLAKNVK